MDTITGEVIEMTDSQLEKLIECIWFCTLLICVSMIGWWFAFTVSILIAHFLYSEHKKQTKTIDEVPKQ